MCSFVRHMFDKISDIKNVDNETTLEIMIPYCGNCSRKTKKKGMTKDEYFCDVLIDTPRRGVVTSDIDGTYCEEMGVYKPINRTIE